MWIEVELGDWGGNSSVEKCPPLNWKVGCLIHSHWVNCRSAPWARVFTSNHPARSTIQASACRQLLSSELIKKLAMCLTRFLCMCRRIKR